MLNLTAAHKDAIKATLEGWIAHKIITHNAYGIVISQQKDGQWFNFTLGKASVVQKHAPEWYVDNAGGKVIISQDTGMDSLLACALYPRLVVDGAFPHGGAVINDIGDLIVGTSGGTEREDIMISTWVLAWIEMILNEEGRKHLQTTKDMGSAYDGPDDGPTAIARFIAGRGRPS